eukprot:1440948-Rhodomonas_salina.1
MATGDLLPPFFDPALSYQENWEKGPSTISQMIAYQLGIPTGQLLKGKYVKAERKGCTPGLQNRPLL